MGAIGLSHLYSLFLILGVYSEQAPEDALSSHIFGGYNNLISPYVNRRNSTTHLNVSLSLSHALLANMNERDWSITVLTTVTYRWTDHRLRWDPSLFDEITDIAAKSSAVWQPDVYPCESSTATTILPEANSAQICYTGDLSLDIYQLINFNCPMNFDAFPFDVQHCLICFALEGISGGTVDLVDVSPLQPDLLGNSEWGFVGNLSFGGRRTTVAGVQSVMVGYQFSLARRPFFWVTLIIVPSSLICLVSLVGIFFAGEERFVENTVTIGLTTMTSVMLVVTILADSLAKADNLPGLGWFVLIDIAIVCAAVIAALVLDELRSLAIPISRKKGKTAQYAAFLVSKRAYRATCISLFLLSIFGLVLNVALSWSITSVPAHVNVPYLDKTHKPPPPPPRY